jgi:hypothetical protein
MKVIFHKDFTEVYAYDPAAQAGRMEAICRALEGYVEFEEPNSATDADLELCHTKDHIHYVKQHSPAAGLSKQQNSPMMENLPSGSSDPLVTTQAQIPAGGSVISTTCVSP